MTQSMTNAWQTGPVLSEVATRQVTGTQHGLGTTIRLTIFGTGQQRDLDDAFQLVRDFEDRLTVNRDQSEVMAINAAAGEHAVQVSASTYALIKVAVTVSREENGFNAAIGPLVKLWRIGFQDATVPDQAAIDDRLALIDPTQIMLDDANFAVMLTQPGMKLDLGGIAKGYIADRIQDLWRSRGIAAGIIDLGGNLLVMGASPNRVSGLWSIGIQSPMDPRGHLAAAVKLFACSAVTSGIYERHLTANGHDYHHILDPRTGYPHDNELASVTVFSRRSLDGEIETTRLFFSGPELPDWGQGRADLYGALLITRDKRLIPLGLPMGAISVLDDQYQLVTATTN